MATTIKVRIVSFIRPAYISDPNVFSPNTRYKGDNRGFDPDTANTQHFRTAQEIDVHFTNTSITYDHYTQTGITEKNSYNSTTGVWSIAATGQAPTSGLQIDSVSYSGFSSATFKVSCEEQNPLYPFAPAISYSFDVTVFGAVMISGAHDGFPDYEVYHKQDAGNWVALYQWDAAAHGQGPVSLFAPMEITVTPIQN